MSDRIKGFTVALEADLKDEDAQPLAEAIRCLRGVINVTGIIANSDDWINRSQIERNMQKRIFAAIRET